MDEGDDGAVSVGGSTAMAVEAEAIEAATAAAIKVGLRGWNVNIVIAPIFSGVGSKRHVGAFTHNYCIASHTILRN